MSLFGNLFSSKPNYPTIDPSSTAALRIDQVKAQLSELASQVKDPLEVVPAEQAAYVFIGKPPKHFGMAWIHDGKVSGLNKLVDEHDLKPLEVEKVVAQLRDAYERNADINRFCTTVQDRDVVITPSAKLEKEVHEIIEKVVRN